MPLTDNRYFLLASAQLFPLDFIDPTHLEVDDEALILAKQAYSSYRDGQLKIALEQYTDAIQRFPDQPFFYACRSILNMELGDEEGAFYDYQVAKGADMNYHAFLEWIENRPIDETPMGEYAEFKEILEEALESAQQFDSERTLKLYTYAHAAFPDEVDILVYRGAMLTRLLRYDKALADLNQAIALAPDHFQAYLFRAKLFQAIQEPAKAKADFDKANKIEPDAGIIYEERGSFLTALKSYDEALADFNKLVTLLPEDFYVYTLRADLFEKMENWEDAITDYSKAISLNPYYADLYAYRADMKERLGDREGAIEDRRTFDELEEE